MVLLPFGVGAQFGNILDLAGLNIDPNSSLSSELDIQLIPTYPTPFTTMFVELAMYTEDLDSAVIEWLVNDKSIQIGRGFKSFNFKTGGVGESTTVTIKITLSRGAEFSRSFSLTPTGVEMVWEADSYVPAFYKGKALHPRQGRLKVVAMPQFMKNGSLIDSKKLIYTWSDGFQKYPDQSGYGRNILVIDGHLLRSVEEISVLVREPETGLVAESFLDISTSDPEIVFYRNDPYYGYIFDQALGKIFDLEPQEIEVVAAPYFFTREGSFGLEYSWRLNGSNAPELQNSRTAVFRKPEGESGRSIISLEIKNLNKILQFTSTNLTMQFNEE